MATNTVTTTNPSHSPSNSQGSSTNPPCLSPSLQHQHRPLKEEAIETGGGGEEDTAMDTGISGKKPNVHDGFQNFTEEEILKYQKYEADFARRLKAKYFSNKDIYGGDIFDLTVAIGDETVKASRRSPTRSYADPKQSLVNEDKVSASRAETFPSVSNGILTPRKSS